MVEFVRERLPQVEVLCRQYGVRELQLFGSALGEGFDPERSDIDLVADASTLDATAYFAFHEALETLFGRKVDLLEKAAVRNPYMVRAIKARREFLYAG